MVPNAALRWTPVPEAIAPQNRGNGKTVRASGAEAPASAAGNKEDGQKTVWTPLDGLVRPIPVRAGLSDGAWTEIEGDGIEEGVEIVIGEQAKGAAEGSKTVNPFTPKLPRRGPRP
jgi:HlyD family secretion protein